eukprot:3205954-Pleurochrysis_carterae.AAC.1
MESGRGVGGDVPNFGAAQSSDGYPGRKGFAGAGDQARSHGPGECGHPVCMRDSRSNKVLRFKVSPFLLRSSSRIEITALCLAGFHRDPRTPTSRLEPGPPGRSRTP